MSFLIELPKTYTFSLCINRGGHTIGRGRFGIFGTAVSRR